jgi:glycosyltransferase involved in cell wall biosynthesis
MARGAEGHHINSIVDALKASGHDVEVIGPPGIGSKDRDSEFPVDKTDSRESGLRVLWKTLSRRCPQWLFEVLELAYNFWAIPKLYKATSVKTGFFYERYAFFLLAGAFVARLRRLPFLLEVNEVTGLKRARGQFFTRLNAGLERRVFQRADAIFVVSSALKERVAASGVQKERIVVVPNAVNLDQFRTDQEKVDALRSKYGFQGSVVLGFVGWFDDWDNLETLLRRVSEIGAEMPELRLMLVGSGRTMTRLTEQVAELGLQEKVALTGPVQRKDVPDFISAMDICLIPDSNVFGSPIVLFEYMALGKPVLARTLPPITDVIEDDVNGLLFTHMEDAGFERQLKRLCRDGDLRKTIGRAAREAVIENHTWSGNARKILSACDRVRER